MIHSAYSRYEKLLKPVKHTALGSALNFVHMKMLGILTVFLLTTLAVSANPVSGYLSFPAHTMVAENVLVGVTDKGAVVSGRYRFRVTPDAPDVWREPPYTLDVQLPVPVPVSAKNFEDIESMVHPFMTIKGAKYAPEKVLFSFDAPSLPKEAKLAVFYFHVKRDDLENEFELLIQYDQPVVPIGGKEMVYYVPFLPTYERYEKQMNLRKESYLITFESYGSTTLHLAYPVTYPEQTAPQLVSMRPKNKEVIAVERIPDRSSHPATTSGHHG